MLTDETDRGGKGSNLLIYPSSLLGSGRLGKIARSLQATGAFDETVIVGIRSDGIDEAQQIDRGVRIERTRGASLRGFLGGVRIMALWPLRVYRRYRKQHLAAVAAQNVYVLPLVYHLSRRTGAVFAYNAHELETESIGARGLKQRIAKLIERRYIHRVDVLSVVNDSIADWYRQHYPGVAPVVLTNTPVDDGKTIDLRAQLAIPDGELLYIHVGFLMGGRSIPLLLDAFTATPNVHIAFLGDGYLRPQVEAAAASASNIHLVPVVAPDEVVSVVRGADVGLCLIEYVSLSDELSTPNKLMEALAAGVPPLSSNLVEARRLLGPELAQVWVLDAPAEQLIGALERIGPAEIAAFREAWKGIPSWDEQAVALLEAYGRALADRAAGSGALASGR
ncbi:glycosyltransferase [Microbacterium sp.]|uniref:glycosyltransferase n=1 Tax=Microbacterium sp. TaxID=51671 RepID=UPI003A8E0C9B